MTAAIETRIPTDGASAADGSAAPMSQRSAPRHRLFAKYAAALVGLVSLVLLINGSLDVWFSYEEAKEAAVQLQREKAAAAAASVLRLLLNLQAAGNGPVEQEGDSAAR